MRQALARRGYLVIGVGVRGRLFVEALHRLNPSAPIWIYDVSELSIRACMARTAVRRCDHTDLMNIASAVDLTIIASPAHTHLNYVGSLVSQSRRVLSEKPLFSKSSLANDAADRRIREYSDRIWIGYSERTNPHTSQYRTLIEAALSQRYKGGHLTCHRARPCPEARNLSTLDELAIHDLDLFSYKKVSALKVTTLTEGEGSCTINGIIDHVTFTIAGTWRADYWRTEAVYVLPDGIATMANVTPYGDAERIIGITTMLERVLDGQHAGDVSDVHVELGLWSKIASHIRDSKGCMP